MNQEIRSRERTSLSKQEWELIDRALYYSQKESAPTIGIGSTWMRLFLLLHKK
ncbi:hypothetical protein [Paenibacillus sp. URB8-2]|uniref:hypothetical protein n=1 Tax=Paenibacillus sp. URB8-2 TaxID=2741301 RepID=UPI0015B941D4|nr:hypothetical protein [Paenibacillus sp. URB8-2]BCG60028.1 hypothetical protein PUR_34530 [Paenibacillus sp. URB8-2]